MKKIVLIPLLCLCITSLCMSLAYATEVQTDVPSPFPSSVSNLQVAPLSSYNMDIAYQVLLDEREASMATYTEIPNYTDRGMGSTSFIAKEYAVNVDGDLQTSLFGYDGFFHFYRQLSDRYVNPNLSDEGALEGWGHVDRSGQAQNSGLTAEEATTLADDLIAQLHFPFESEWALTKAFSPTENTYLSTGYYEVYYRQMLNDLPVALFNVLPSSLMNGENLTPASFYGIVVRVFHDGVQNVEARWLTETSRIENTENVMSLSQASLILEDLRQSPQFSEMESLVIDTVSLEYAVCSDSANHLLLVPAWTFGVMGDARMFYGIRINAINGSLLIYNGWVI